MEDNFNKTVVLTSCLCVSTTDVITGCGCGTPNVGIIIGSNPSTKCQGRPQSYQCLHLQIQCLQSPVHLPAYRLRPDSSYPPHLLINIQNWSEQGKVIINRNLKREIRQLSLLDTTFNFIVSSSLLAV